MHFHGLVMTAIVAELSAVKRNRADAPGGAASALSDIYIYVYTHICVCAHVLSMRNAMTTRPRPQRISKF